MKTDEQLAHEVERAIGMIPSVNLNEFRVTVKNGRAQIIGLSRLLADKYAIIEAALRVDGITAVDDAAAVETPRPPRDQDLAADIDMALDEDEEVDARRVGAGVARGQAMMQGQARSLGELTSAIDTASAVPNTVNVIDSARIQNPYGSDQIDLVNAVADALTGHPTLNGRPIRPILEGTGKVLLTGRVRSDEERRMALAAAAEVPGLHTVREELQIEPDDRR